MKVAVCDDNKVMLDYLSNLISETLTSCTIKSDISKFVSGNDFILQHEEAPFDIVFLDIKMPDIDGFEVAKRIRKLSEKTYIIFITTEDTLVYDSFEFRPFNFIPKGNSEVLKIKLNNVIHKLAEYIGDNHPICLDLPYGEKRYVDANDIIYISSKSNYLDIYCKNNIIHLRGRIESIMETLPQKFFVRIHNRYIVNMCHLCKIYNTGLKVLLDNGSELDISRAYKSDFSEKYNIFLRNNF